MPKLTPAQVREIYDSACAREYSRRRQAMKAGSLSLKFSPAEMDEVAQIGLQAVADAAASEAPLQVVSIVPEQHPLMLVVQRQARQLDHISNALSEDDKKRFESILHSQWNFSVVFAKLGGDPSLWESFAEILIPMNQQLIDGLVLEGYATLPPAESEGEG